nr:immunoglobulin heavy chain junction region [Mus musculus]MBK4186790.1 immunoglobulin heavy chain junction region [Mus musculus]MBK4186792.1 immunoglobulin heavy chain junction region [Mus musculus]
CVRGGKLIYFDFW